MKKTWFDSKKPNRYKGHVRIAQENYIVEINLLVLPFQLKCHIFLINPFPKMIYFYI